MNILLACNAGMSTSFLVQKMKEEAKKQNKTYKIWATDVDSVFDEEDNIDVILLGPQVSGRLREVREFADEFGAPVAVIDRENYGRCNGAAVLEQAEKLVKGE